MLGILKSLIREVVIFFILYAIFAVVIERLSANVPRSWDPTGMGMVAMIFLFFGFVFGAFRIGASYSDSLVEQEPGTVLGLFKRPIRSMKYGLISLALNFLLVYLILILSDRFFN